MARKLNEEERQQLKEFADVENQNPLQDFCEHLVEQRDRAMQMSPELTAWLTIQKAGRFAS